MEKRTPAWSAVRIENEGGHGRKTRVYVDDVDVSGALQDVQVSIGVNDAVRIQIRMVPQSLMFNADRVAIEALFPRRPFLERMFGLRKQGA